MLETKWEEDRATAGWNSRADMSVFNIQHCHSTSSKNGGDATWVSQPGPTTSSKRVTATLLAAHKSMKMNITPRLHFSNARMPWRFPAKNSSPCKRWALSTDWKAPDLFCHWKEAAPSICVCVCVLMARESGGSHSKLHKNILFMKNSGAVHVRVSLTEEASTRLLCLQNAIPSEKNKLCPSTLESVSGLECDGKD